MLRPHSTSLIPRPAADEYDAYYETYVGKVGQGPILSILESQDSELQRMLAGVDEDGGDFRYASGKWSIKEVIGHLIDTERVFSFRALWFARGETRPLPGMDQDAFVEAADFQARQLADLASEATLLRRSTISLFGSFSAGQLSHRGAASDCEFTTCSTAFIIAGHERHHLDVLYERYGLGVLS